MCHISIWWHLAKASASGFILFICCDYSMWWCLAGALLRGPPFSAAAASACGGISQDLSIGVQPIQLLQLQHTVSSLQGPSKGVQSTQLFQPQQTVTSHQGPCHGGTIYTPALASACCGISSGHMSVQPLQFCKHSIRLPCCHVTPVTYLFCQHLKLFRWVFLLVFWVFWGGM